MPTQKEYLLDPNNKRTILYPIKHHGIWDFYLIHLSMHWVPSEIQFLKDSDDWSNALNDNERHYAKYILAFFAVSDFIVIDNQYKDSDEVCILEYKFYNDNKIDRENIHAITYANMIETYITDEKEKEFLLDSIKTIPSVKEKADWMIKYINTGDFVHRLVACAIMEGVFFSGAFCGIFWLKKRGLMKALCEANEFIARDEASHRDFACMIYRNYVINKLPIEELKEMIIGAVNIEKKFVKESLPVSLIGMNENAMCEHIENVADLLCNQLIGENIYGTKTPFEWMNLIGQSVKTNFFEAKVTTYAKQTLLTNKEDNMLSVSEDNDY